MTDTPQEPFSRRFGYTAPEAPIQVREDAPAGFRHAILTIAAEAGVSSREIVGVVRRTLGLPRSRDWTPSVQMEDAEDQIELCHWAKVYDIAEAFYGLLAWRYSVLTTPEQFQAKINDHCLTHGIGWKMVDGRFEVRGSGPQETAQSRSVQALEQEGKATSASELEKALQDLSKRPEPDITGAVQHVGAAIECLARDLCGDSSLTLGDIIKSHPRMFPGAYRKLAEAVWGIASNNGRHLEEGGEPTLGEAMLLVGTVASLCGYMVSRRPGEPA